MKILMLHGWTQNAEVFRSKLHPFVRKVERVKSPKGKVELTFATAPHDLPPSIAGDRPNARAWFYYDEHDKTARVDVFSPVRREYHGWCASRAYIASLYAEHGPFDVVVGFSQGAVVCHQLLVDIETVVHHADKYGGREAALRAVGFLPNPAGDAASGPSESPSAGQAQDTTPVLDAAYKALLDNPPKAAILVAGFPSRHTHGYPAGELLRTRTLHISASNDTTVDPLYQAELHAAFQGAEFHTTTQGHAMPQRAADLQVVCSFLERVAADMAGPSS